jgi:hypothetical protein
MPKAARERVASPPAGTATSPRSPGLPPGPRPKMGEVGLYVSETGTCVNRPVTTSLLRPRNDAAVFEVEAIAVVPEG